MPFNRNDSYRFFACKAYHIAADGYLLKFCHRAARIVSQRTSALKG